MGSDLEKEGPMNEQLPPPQGRSWMMASRLTGMAARAASAFVQAPKLPRFSTPEREKVPLTPKGQLNKTTNEVDIPIPAPPPLSVRVQMAAASAPASNAEDRLLQVRQRILARSGAETSAEQAASRSGDGYMSDAEADSEVNRRSGGASGSAIYISDVEIGRDAHSVAEKSSSQGKPTHKRKYRGGLSRPNIEELQQHDDWKRRRLERERAWKAHEPLRRAAKEAAKKSVASKVSALVAAGSDSSETKPAAELAAMEDQSPAEVEEVEESSADGRRMMPQGQAPAASAGAEEATDVSITFQISVAMLSGDEIAVTAPANLFFRSVPAPSVVVNAAFVPISYCVLEGGRELVMKLSRELPALSSILLTAPMDVLSEQPETGYWQLLTQSGASPRKIYERLFLYTGKKEDVQSEDGIQGATAEASASSAPLEDKLEDLEKSRPQLTAPLWRDDEKFVLARHGKRTSTVYEVWTTSCSNAAGIQSVEEVQDAYADHHRLIYEKKRPLWNLQTWKTRLRCGNVSDWIRRGVTVLRAACHGPGGEEVVVGYISGDKRSGCVHINHIIVLPEHRQRGVGRLLFDAFVKYFEGLQRGVTSEVRLEVYSANDSVKQWYLALGFKRFSKGDVMEMKREIPYVEVEDVCYTALAPLISSLQTIFGSFKNLAKDIEGLDVRDAGFDVAQSEAFMSRVDQLLKEMDKPEHQAIHEDTKRNVAPRLLSWRQDAMKLKAWLLQLQRIQWPSTEENQPRMRCWKKTRRPGQE
mmetsp:Transcript_112528/g.195295  ORF Transcript_112528/g.195295 Transcript_112528/m.195295 type:complete len:757 (-) Transcript_112528:240-2510(-)